jgi:hypothetical protein
MKERRCGKIWGCRGRKTASLRVSAYSAKVGTGFAIRIRAKTLILVGITLVFAGKTLTLDGSRLGCAANAPR